MDVLRRAATSAVGRGIVLSACGGHGSTESTLPSIAQSNHTSLAKTALANSRTRAEALVAANGRHVQSLPVPGQYPVTADMPVSRPNETPCSAAVFELLVYGF
jgi:hypothetical protein